jgi:ApbE superfamily uncharacterized protein (UPF0280 family)
VRAQIQLLPDGRRLRLNDGPIDLIVEASGTRNAINNAYQAASTCFVTILDELCHELPLLRQPPNHPPRGCIAKKMYAAVLPYAPNNFITPMAAVAGAVAEEILWSMTTAANLTRAYVNNGGDIALHLAPGESFTIGLIDRPDHPSLFGTTTLHSHQPTRGIATSGWRGRSFSLGIADAVTVLAETAAQADAAATIIANAVNLPNHPSITRVPANSLAPDSDLGPRLVIQAVDQLTLDEIAEALEAGTIVAHSLIARHLIHSAALHLSGKTVVVSTTDTHVGAAALGRPTEKIPA